MSNCNFRNSIFGTLSQNIGRVCTVFTASGGASGDGFTGLVASVDDTTCRLITALPSGPDLRGLPGGSHSGRCGCGSRDRLGTSCTIPLDSIVCVAANDR